MWTEKNLKSHRQQSNGLLYPIQALFWWQTINTKSFLSSKTFQISPYHLLSDRKHILLSPLLMASWYPIFFHPVLFRYCSGQPNFRTTEAVCPHARHEFGLQPLGWYQIILFFRQKAVPFRTKVLLHFTAFHLGFFELSLEIFGIHCNWLW